MFLFLGSRVDQGMDKQMEWNPKYFESKGCEKCLNLTVLA